MTDCCWHIGRKAIIAYLEPFLDLPADPFCAWQKVRRWRNRYGLPIESQPNRKPYIDASVFEAYWINFQKKIKSR